MLDGLGEHAVERPEPRQCAGQAGGAGRVAGGQAPFERGPEVVEVAAEAVKPCQLVGATDLELALLGPLDVEVDVAVAGLVGVEVGEDVECVGPQRVEQPVSVVAAAGDHRLLDERRQQLERRVRAFTGDVQRGVEVERAGEDAEPCEELSLVGCQELEAPVDRGAQCLLPLGDRGTAVDQQPEAVLESGSDGCGAQHVGAGGGELDGQRQPVEGDAHRGDVSGHCVVDREVGPHGGRPFDEQRDGGVGGDLLGGGGVRRGHVQRRHRPRELPGDAQGSPARGQDAHAGRGSERGRRQQGDGGHDVLARVEHEQHVARRQRVGDGGDRIVAGCDGHAGGGRDRGRHESGVVDRAEVDVAHRPRVAGGDFDRQARLARSGRASKGHRTVPLQMVLEP